MTDQATERPPQPDGPGPLDGVRVVDFTEYVAGPYGTMMLADMGAEVIKVEPVGGDHWRHQAPVAPNESRSFLGLNRGKHSLALNVREERGRELAHRLIATADVVVMNYRPGVPARLGLDYETLSAVNPRLIYAHITAFGHHGPYSHRGGFDLLSQAAAGIMSYEERVERGGPAGIRTVAPSDLTAGMFTAFAVVSALYRRAETGRGQAVSTSLFAAALGIQYRPLSSVEDRDVAEREAFRALVDSARADGASYEEIVALQRQALGRPALANYYRVYETQDGMVAVACLNNRLRRGVTRPGRRRRPHDRGPVFAAPAPPPRSTSASVKRWSRRFGSAPAPEWLELLVAAGVPASPFNMTQELYVDPHVQANDLIPTFDHPTLGKVRTARSPIDMSESRTGATDPAPTLGSHTHAVLAELGLSDVEIDALEGEGLIARWRPQPAQAAAAADGEGG